MVIGRPDPMAHFVEAEICLAQGVSRRNTLRVIWKTLTCHFRQLGLKDGFPRLTSSGRANTYRIDSSCCLRERVGRALGEYVTKGTCSKSHLRGAGIEKILLSRELFLDPERNDASGVPCVDVSFDIVVRDTASAKAPEHFVPERAIFSCPNLKRGADQGMQGLPVEAEASPKAAMNSDADDRSGALRGRSVRHTQISGTRPNKLYSLLGDSRGNFSYLTVPEYAAQLESLGRPYSLRSPTDI